MTAWNETQDGANMANAFDQLRQTYTVTMPKHINWLTVLSRRSIRG